MGAMTPATAILLSGIGSAVGSVGAGLFSSSSASSNNAKALGFNEWSQLQAQEFQRQMYNKQKMDQENFYTKYQSPEAIAKQLQKLGLNPANVLGQGQGLGGSPVSMPSGMSSPALSAPSLENEGTSMAQAIQAIGSSMASIAKAGQTNEQSQEYLNTFNERVNSLILKNNEQELLNAKAQWDLYAAKEKLPYEIQEMVLNAYKLKYEGEYTQSLKALTDIQTYIEEHSKDFTIEQRNLMTTLLGRQIAIAVANEQLLREKRVTERTQQGLNISLAQYNKALSRTEDALRDGKIELQSLSADLATIEKYQAGNDLKFSDSTLQQRIFGTIEQMYREGLISENVYKEGEILSTKRDWAARQEFGQYLNNVVGAASSAMNAYTNYRGVSVNRLNAKERNKIQEKFVDEYVRQSKQNSSAKRSAVLGPDYEMYSDQFFGR